MTTKWMYSCFFFFILKALFFFLCSDVFCRRVCLNWMRPKRWLMIWRGGLQSKVHCWRLNNRRQMLPCRKSPPPCRCVFAHVCVCLGLLHVLLQGFKPSSAYRSSLSRFGASGRGRCLPPWACKVCQKNFFISSLPFLSIISLIPKIGCGGRIFCIRTGCF